MDSRKRARVGSSDYELQVESINKGGGGGDRISGLCDELLHLIISFLPTREVVQTCVLSKRWRNLWCSAPCLDFDEEAFLASSSSSSSSSRTDQLHAAAAAGSSFSTFINYAMLLRDGSNIQKFRLSCSSDNTTSSNAFQYYIVTAMRHKLQVLDFKILQHHQAAENVLPPSLFTCDSLISLILNNVVLPSMSSNIYLSSLKILHLISVKFPSDQLSSTESLFSNSPNLETLTLHNCNFEHLKRFQISASKLRNLIIIQDKAALSSTNITPPFTVISAPNLISLKLHVDLQSRWYLLDNLNSLVEADIHLNKPFAKHIPLVFMAGIFSQLNTAKAITLSGLCLQLIRKELLIPSTVKTMKSQFANTLRLRSIQSKEYPFSNLKLMKLKTWFEDEEVGAITDLLKRSPNVETLVIECNSESSYKENELPLREEKLPSECTLHHLKTIQMRGFRGRKNEVKLLTFLLENAKSLEKMIVGKAST